MALPATTTLYTSPHSRPRRPRSERRHLPGGLPIWATATIADLATLFEVIPARLYTARRQGSLEPAYEIRGHAYFRVVDAIEYLERTESKGYRYHKKSNLSRQQVQ